MEFIGPLINALNLPVAYSLTLAVVSMGFVAYIQLKKINISEKTSSNNAHEKQIELLLQQITMLSSQLESTREQLNELHDRNIDLMGQLRTANLRIAELEDMITRLGERIGNG